MATCREISHLPDRFRGGEGGGGQPDRFFTFFFFDAFPKKKYKKIVGVSPVLLWLFFATVVMEKIRPAGVNFPNPIRIYSSPNNFGMTAVAKKKSQWRLF